jgi:hypothetical protein
MNPTAIDAECITHERAYQILVSASNYCLVFVVDWGAYDEIGDARKRVICSGGRRGMSDADFESYSQSNLARWQYIRRLSGGGEIKQEAA